jgi:hypothetical protein
LLIPLRHHRDESRAVSGTTEFAPASMRLEREHPDTTLASCFEGEPMVQSFRVLLPDGVAGRCWIPTAVAMTIPGFSQPWVAGQLAARVLLLGWTDVAEALTAPGGLRLDR